MQQRDAQQRDAAPGLRLAQALVVVAALATGGRRRRGPAGVDEAALRAGYEPYDMRAGVVFSVLAALLVVMAVVLVLVSVFMARATGFPPSISRPIDLIQGTDTAARADAAGAPAAARRRHGPRRVRWRGAGATAELSLGRSRCRRGKHPDRPRHGPDAPAWSAGARHTRPDPGRAAGPVSIHFQLGSGGGGMAVRTAFAAIALLVALAGVKTAQAQSLSAAQLSLVRFDQQLGATVPANLPFRDETGEPVTFGDYLGQRPAILTLNYFHCQNLCPIELDGLVNGLNGVPLTLGQDFNLVTVSIDPREGPADAADAKARALRGYDRAQDSGGWHVLTGDQQSIDGLTDAVGFRYAYDAQADDFAHPAGVVVLTPDGHVSRYLYGYDFDATDLRLSLVEASQERIGSLADRALLVCYHYDPLTGRATPRWR
jgi:protein SCO1/2